MNEYTLESFINYCDDMQIAEEGFKDTKFFSLLEKGWRMIKDAVNRLFAKLSAFLIKVRSKGDKILVNNAFYNKYYDLKTNIKHMNGMDSTKKREVDDRITELLKDSHKPIDGSGNTISISEISNSLKSVKGELDALDIAANKALFQFKRAKRALNQAKTEVDKNYENLKKSEFGDIMDNYFANSNSIVDEFNKKQSYDIAEKELEQANGKLYQCQLYIRLYTGMLNKLAPNNNE